MQRHQMDNDSNMYRRNATAEESPYYAYPSSSATTSHPADRTHRYSPPSPATYRPRSNERPAPNPTLLTAPSLNRRATDLEAHPYHRPMQSEIVPVSRYGYSSHNPTHTMPNVELPMLKSAKTRRREAWQIDILEAFYQHKHMPDKSEKEMLAARINDTLKYVNIWFQNRRQAAQKKGELQRRETYEHWRTKRQGNGSEYDELPSPDYAAAGPSYFSQSYPPHPTMLVTPNEPDGCRLSPSGSNALALHAPATTSPFAFRLALPQPVAPPRQEYDRQHPYERATYTPPYTSKGLTQPARYFADQRPGLERSVSMRREAPVYGFDLPRTSMERTLPALPPLEPPNSSTTASSALPSPRKESSGSEENSIASSTEKSPLSDLKLPPITSISLPDHMSWSSTLRTRRP